MGLTAWAKPPYSVGEIRARTQREILSSLCVYTDLTFRRSRPSLRCRRIDPGIAPTRALVPGLELHLTIPGKPHAASCGKNTGNNRRLHPPIHRRHGDGVTVGTGHTQPSPIGSLSQSIELPTRYRINEESVKMKEQVVLTADEVKTLRDAAQIFAKFRKARISPEKRAEIALNASKAAATARAKRRAEKEANVPPSTTKD